jgi:hypothetical protein
MMRCPCHKFSIVSCKLFRHSASVRLLARCARDHPVIVHSRNQILCAYRNSALQLEACEPLSMHADHRCNRSRRVQAPAGHRRRCVFPSFCAQLRVVCFCDAINVTAVRMLCLLWQFQEPGCLPRPQSYTSADVHCAQCLCTNRIWGKIPFLCSQECTQRALSCLLSISRTHTHQAAFPLSFVGVSHSNAPPGSESISSCRKNMSDNSD